MTRKRKWQWKRGWGFNAPFVLDNGEHRVDSYAHCICCALSQAVEQYGGNVDLRGLHPHGICYQFLCVVVRIARDTKEAQE